MGKRDFPKAAVTSNFNDVYVNDYTGESIISWRVSIDDDFFNKLEKANMEIGIHTSEELIKALES